MKIINKIFSLALVFSFMLTAMPVKAEEAVNSKLYVWGKVETVGTNRIQIINSTEPSNDCILNIGEDTVIIDAVTGTPVALNSLKRFDRIAAYVSSAMTKSMPPITNAYVVFVNIPEDYRVPRYIEVGEILESNDDSVKLLTADNTLIATFLKEETEMFAYKTKNILGLDDIHAKDEFIVWYEVEMLSMPGQATMVRAMKLPEKKQGWLFENESWYYYQDGRKLTEAWIPSTQGRWYYVGSDGKMVVNTEIDGYVIDADGVYYSTIEAE